jgi:hypothetical protein
MQIYEVELRNEGKAPLNFKPQHQLLPHMSMKQDGGWVKERSDIR